jgi:hypothetical protein
MVYAAFVHGASGLLSFARDGFVMRNGGNLGISPHPVDTYPNCTFGSVPCLTPSASAKALAQNAWTAVSHVNAELAALKPALLSPTSTINYTVDVLQTPNNGTSPIRTLLKTAPDGMYLIAVNLINDNLDAVIQLPLASVTAAAVQFENRSVSTPTGAIRDQFGPFAVHIYKW